MEVIFPYRVLSAPLGLTVDRALVDGERPVVDVLATRSTVDLSLLEDWRRFLQEHDHSTGTVKKYTQAVAHFLAWYEQQERMPLQIATLTPIALIGYRNELQHEQHKSVSTINLRVSALRAWCAWLVDQGYLLLDPAARVKLVGGEVGSKREGLSSSQVNALLRQCTSPVFLFRAARYCTSNPSKVRMSRSPYRIGDEAAPRWWPHGRSVRCRAACLVPGLGNLVAEIAQHRRGTPDNAAAGRRVPKRMDLLCNVGLVSGQVLGQVPKLAADHRADAEDRPEGEHHHADDGQHAIDVPTA